MAEAGISERDKDVGIWGPHGKVKAGDERWQAALLQGAYSRLVFYYGYQSTSEDLMNPLGTGDTGSESGGCRLGPLVRNNRRRSKSLWLRRIPPRLL